jgi:hypothetical protein
MTLRRVCVVLFRILKFHGNRAGVATINFETGNDAIYRRQPTDGLHCRKNAGLSPIIGWLSASNN